MSNETTKTAVPKLRFPEFEEAGEWEETILSKVVKHITTGKLDANAMVENGKYRFYTCAKNYYRIDNYAFDTEAILIAGNGAYLGYIHYYKGKFNAYQRTYVLHGFNINVLYLKYYLDFNFSSRIATEKKEGNTPYIVLGTITDAPLMVPDNEEEQQKIASTLSSLDDLLTAQSAKLVALQAHKRGLMQGLFPAEGETVPKLRFPEFQDAAEWEEKKLVDACRMQAGKFVSASNIHERKQDGFFPCYGGNGLRGYTKTSTHQGKYPLVGRQGALCGNVMLATGEFHATEHAIVTTPKEKVEIDWLYYQLILLNLIAVS